ncbi:type II toxin-antitoxin system VapC family toxin [Candidatus Entotheonella palauensis]|uniref:type II toxin-antitoxin system VapC family toxin n=1 Tax=Candidatus Entotheonella palauensis TaxID=93172 RepID=UPI000B7F6881|nr:type II toxin-antitoxin system VapC family toxin [Candidatus Entotheonella palauensis]
MILVDVNVLVYAHREDVNDHSAYHAWLHDVVTGNQAYGMSELVLSGFLRVVTHPRIFDPPSPLTDALAFTQAVRTQPHCVRIVPGPRHWDIFEELCQLSGARGNLIPDAYFAALAIESGSEWITTDRDFGRFPGLRWRHPLAG